MRWAKTWLILCLALLWAPLTVHCQIEAATGVDILSCTFEEEGGHCGDGSCCPWESAQYHLPDNGPLSDLLLLALPASPPVDCDSQTPPDSRRLEGNHPPAQLVRTWQFVLRAALPPRAPSLNS